MLAEIKARFGRLNVLVNNAGVAPTVRADILEASALAYLAAINRLRSAVARGQRLHPHVTTEQP